MERAFKPYIKHCFLDLYKPNNICFQTLQCPIFRGVISLSLLARIFPAFSQTEIFVETFFILVAVARLVLLVQTSGLLYFLGEKLNFKFSFIHILRIMCLKVPKVGLNIKKHEEISNTFAF